MSSRRQLRSTLQTLRESHKQFSEWYGDDSNQAMRVARLIQQTERKLNAL